MFNLVIVKDSTAAHTGDKYLNEREIVLVYNVIFLLFVFSFYCCDF